MQAALCVLLVPSLFVFVSSFFCFLYAVLQISLLEQNTNMDGDTGYSCPSPSPATSSTIMAPLVLAIRTHKNQSNVPPPGKKTPVIVHTESAQVKVEPVKKTKKEKKKTLAAPAVADRFSVQYGVNFAGLEPWIKLCRDLGVEGPLNSKTQCKKVSEDQLSFAPRHFLSESI